MATVDEVNLSAMTCLSRWRGRECVKKEEGENKDGHSIGVLSIL